MNDHDTPVACCITMVLHKDKEGLTLSKAFESLKFYREAFPRGSNGNSNTRKPAAMNIAPEIQIGMDVVISAYNAMMGACIFGTSAPFTSEIRPSELAP